MLTHKISGTAYNTLYRPTHVAIPSVFPFVSAPADFLVEKASWPGLFVLESPSVGLNIHVVQSLSPPHYSALLKFIKITLVLVFARMFTITFRLHSKCKTGASSNFNNDNLSGNVQNIERNFERLENRTSLISQEMMVLGNPVLLNLQHVE